jgi:predicted small lipoprotein YifL
MSAYRRLILGVLIAALLAPLAGCGKKNVPEPPPDQPNEFPRTYPKPGS